MSRILVLAPEPIRPRMAGMGIRAAEIARHLSLADHPVLLLSPGDPAEAPAWLTEAGVRVSTPEMGKRESSPHAMPRLSVTPATAGR